MQHQARAARFIRSVSAATRAKIHADIEDRQITALDKIYLCAGSRLPMLNRERGGSLPGMNAHKQDQQDKQETHHMRGKVYEHSGKRLSQIVTIVVTGSISIAIANGQTGSEPLRTFGTPLRYLNAAGQWE